MLLIHMLWIIISIVSVKTSMYQLRFMDTAEFVCVYLYDSMLSQKIDTVKVKLNIALELLTCHLNSSNYRSSNNMKEVLIIRLSDQCTLAQQLNILANITRNENYYAIILSINRTCVTFEQTLLSYLYDQINSPILNHSIANDHDFNQTLIGFIDASVVHRLNNRPSNPFLHRLQRKHISFDPSIFLMISLIVIAMIIGNEWHRRIFIDKILQHSHSAHKMKIKWGLILGLLFFLVFSLFYLINRYVMSINGEIYVMIYMTSSVLVIYICFKESSYWIMKKFYKKDDLKSSLGYQWWQRILLLVSWSVVTLMFCRKLPYIGWILTNLIAFCLTVVIVAQMRIGNFMMCMISLSFIWLFECLLWIGKVYWGSQWNSTAETKKLVISHSEMIFQMYTNVLHDNDELDYWLNRGSINLFQVNIRKYIKKANLPLVFSFPRFLNNNDSCGFDTGRIYFSIDDVLFPSLLINFCRTFDVGNEIRFRMYYIQAILSYILGICLSYVLILLTKYDQLSSTIIYPIILISTMLTGIVRGELQKLFRGTLTAFEQHPKQESRNSF